MKRPEAGGITVGSFGGTALSTVLVLLLAGLVTVRPVGAQDVLERTPNLSGGWVGIPWTLHVSLPHRFHDVQPGDGVTLGTTTTFTGVLGLPTRSAAGAAFAIQSPTVPGEPDELEVFIRHRLLEQAYGLADAAVSVAWNAAAGSVDLEAQLARRLGPVRVMGAGRWFSDGRGVGDAGAALALGAVWHPLPRTAPIAVAGDVAVPVAGSADREVAWGAGVQVGLPFTALTLSLQAANTAATTLQGRSFGVAETRYGFEMALPVPVGFFVGGYPEREAAVEAVSEVSETRAVEVAADAVVDIRRYAFGPLRTVVPAGSVVEWVNRDGVVHTATAEDGAWDSGGILAGESWRARFDEPGIYPYYCGPHPFMKGVVIVLER